MHTEVVRARGHENVTAAHGSTFEVTTDDYLTPAGDCILGIEADSAPTDFDAAFVTACQDPTASITATLEVDGLVEEFEGRGHPGLSFESDRSLVARTSEYVDGRTVAVGMDGAATDCRRDAVDRLAAGAPLRLTLTVD